MVISGLVCVTGANGFIGSHLCQALASAGQPVRRIVRRGGASVHADGQAVVSDLRRSEELEPALRGSHAVVHVAGRAHVLRERTRDPLAAFRQANVETTRALLAASRRAGVERFVLVSSVAALHDGAADSGIRSLYGVSKQEAEQVVLDGAGAMDVTILRPPMVYGPRMLGNPLRLFDLVSRQVPLPVRSVRNHRSIAFVGNVVAAIAGLLRSQGGSGPYYVSDGPAISTPDLVRAIADALGVRARLIGMPPFALRLLASVANPMARLFWGNSLRQTVDSLVGSLVVEDAPLRHRIGTPLPYSTTAGLQCTAQWFQDRAVAGLL